MTAALVLSSGGARGWSHLGVLDALAELELEPDIICGASIGALVGGAYLAGEFSRLREWALSLTPMRVAPFFDISLVDGGLIAGRKLLRHLSTVRTSVRIEELSKPFGCVATDLGSGEEVWFRAGELLPAIRASLSIPGLFAPAPIGDRLYVDGALLNPVPISLARAMGASRVVAIDVNANVSLESNSRFSASHRPSVIDTVARAIDITQDFVARSRLAGTPPELLIAPQVQEIGPLEFHRAETAREAGFEATMAMKPQLVKLFGHVRKAAAKAAS